MVFKSSTSKNLLVRLDNKSSKFILQRSTNWDHLQSNCSESLRLLAVMVLLHFTVSLCLDPNANRLKLSPMVDLGPQATENNAEILNRTSFIQLSYRKMMLRSKPRLEDDGFNGRFPWPNDSSIFRQTRSLRSRAKFGASNGRKLIRKITPTKVIIGAHLGSMAYKQISNWTSTGNSSETKPIVNVLDLNQLNSTIIRVYNGTAFVVRATPALNSSALPTTMRPLDATKTRLSLNSTHDLELTPFNRTTTTEP